MSPPAKVPPLPDASQTVQVTPYNYNTAATVSTPQIRQTILLPDVNWVEIAGGEFLYRRRALAANLPDGTLPDHQ